MEPPGLSLFQSLLVARKHCGDTSWLMLIAGLRH
jgi:hypothetical protein